MRSLVRRPSFTAATTARTASLASPGSNSKSTPASNARTAVSPGPYIFVTALHIERVGADQSLEAQLFAQQSREHVSGNGCGFSSGSSAGDGEVRGHHRVNARFNRCLKRHELHLIQALARSGDPGQIHMRVRIGVAMAGEVLGGHKHEVSPGRNARLQ